MGNRMICIPCAEQEQVQKAIRNATTTIILQNSDRLQLAMIKFNQQLWSCKRIAGLRFTAFKQDEVGLKVWLMVGRSSYWSMMAQKDKDRGLNVIVKGSVQTRKARQLNDEASSQSHQ